MPSFSSSLKGPCGAHGRKTGQLLASHTHSSDKEGPSSSPSSNLDSRLISCLELAIPSLLSSLHSSFFFLVTHLPSLETRHTRHSSLAIRGAALTSGRVRCVRRIMIPNCETTPARKRRHGQVTRAGTLNILPPRLGFWFNNTTSPLNLGARGHSRCRAQCAWRAPRSNTTVKKINEIRTHAKCGLKAFT